MDSEREETFISLITDLTFVASSADWNLEVTSLFNQLFDEETDWDDDIYDFFDQMHSLNPKMKFVSLIDQFIYFRDQQTSAGPEWEMVLVSLTAQIIFLVSSMELDSESELRSLINQIVSIFNSKPDSELELVSLITQTMRLGVALDSDSEPTQESELLSLISRLVSLIPELELTSLIKHIISRFRSMNWEPLPFISFCPQRELMKDGRCVVIEDVQSTEVCRPFRITFTRCSTEIHFHCEDCNGKKHDEFDKTPVEVKHPLHPKHSLQAFFLHLGTDFKECYCCDETIFDNMFYYCPACDFPMSLNCVKKPPLALSIDVPKWHDHPLALFPSQTPYPCSLCALTHTTCPLYICPPCDFVVHRNCLSLPKVIKISRHPHHRISFTPSFEKGDRCCRVCQRKINNDYGGYSCIKEGCLYAAHSRCATQSNVWDGEELEGVPEIEEEVLEPFVRISDGIIQHFSHQQHYLKLDENIGRDYDENMMCQACNTPIYFGNFYFCMECEFVIHEKCAGLPLKIYHPIHSHQLTLVGGYESVKKVYEHMCSACHLNCTNGFFYKCGIEDCYGFKLHVQCVTTSEPCVHGSHTHPLFLTSKPHERRKCSVCDTAYNNTFNCIEGECDEFSLCFRCATIPQTVRYKHDKHIISLSYGEVASTTTTYWCEVCEGKVNPKKWFYKCDEYCCVTLHIECLIGKDLYMKLGLVPYYRRKVSFVPNNQHMTRPFCSFCKKRCPYKTTFQTSKNIYCSIYCSLRISPQRGS